MSEAERKLPFKCPNPQCGTVFTQPLSWFKNTKRITCFACNHEFTVDFEKLPKLKPWLKYLQES